MKQSTKSSLKIAMLMSSVFAVTFISGCGSFETIKVETVPEVEVHDLNSEITQKFGDIEVPHIEIGGKETTEEGINISKIADPTMDIENEFFVWATDNSKALVNLQISFFRPDFYGFYSENSATTNKMVTAESGNAGGNANTGCSIPSTSNVGLTESERMWLSSSIYITEADVLKYKAMPWDAMERLDFYWALFFRAMGEMNNYYYDCAQAIYNTDPARYTGKDYYDKRAAWKYEIINDKAEARTETIINFSAECEEAAYNQVIAKYGSKYAADYLRLIGVK